MYLIKWVREFQTSLGYRSLANKLLFNFFLSSMASRRFSYIIISGQVRFTQSILPVYITYRKDGLGYFSVFTVGGSMLRHGCAAFNNIGQVRAELFSSRHTRFCITIYIVKAFILLGEIL